jgi:hypothetical protein
LFVFGIRGGFVGEALPELAVKRKGDLRLRVDQGGVVWSTVDRRRC